MESSTKRDQRDLKGSSTGKRGTVEKQQVLLFSWSRSNKFLIRLTSSTYLLQAIDDCSWKSRRRPVICKRRSFFRSNDRQLNTLNSLSVTLSRIGKRRPPNNNSSPPNPMSPISFVDFFVRLVFNVPKQKKIKWTLKWHDFIFYSTKATTEICIHQKSVDFDLIFFTQSYCLIRCAHLVFSSMETLC